MPKEDLMLLTDVSSFKLVHKGNAWMLAITLINGDVCIVNSIIGLEGSDLNEAFISHILAPNHYHNKALNVFSEHYPQALLCSTKAAMPRLEKITDLNFSTLNSIVELLPKGVSLIEPQGLKTGEVWVRFSVGKEIAWFVVDAFCGSKMTSKKQECDSPELLKTFPSYGVANRGLYKDWVLAQIEQDKPVMIIPCHGCVIRGANLASKLKQLITTL